MAKAKVLRIYLHQNERRRALSGDFNLMKRIKSAFESQGFRVEFRKNSNFERLKSADRRGYSLFHMDDPFHDKALTLRRAYYYPFWRIENTAKRWDFRVARQRFDPEETDMGSAKKWADNWRRWLFRNAAAKTEKRGAVYLPLQGRLLEHRSFQTMSPLDMLKQTIEMEPDRRILLGRHPKERYDPAELEPFKDIVAQNDRVEFETEGVEQALRVCDYVVTQNSAVALSGFFFHKPAILFAKIDFHHIAANVTTLGVEKAFQTVQTKTPDFDGYLHWFIAKNSIKADAGDAEAQILRSVRSFGWEV